MIQALLECDSMGRVRLKQIIDYQGGDRLKPPRLEIADNVLTATAEVDSMSIYLALKERYTTVDNYASEVIKEPPKVSLLDRIEWLFIGVAVALGLFIIKKITS